MSIAALYVAPILAGSWGAGWDAVAGFAAVFFLFNLAMERVPREPLLALASAGVVAVLALVLVGLGWGARGLFGIDEIRPWWPWGLMALAAILLSRLAFPPKLAREIDALLDRALTEVQAAGARPEGAANRPPAPHSGTIDAEALARMSSALDDLPATAASDEVARIVLPLSDQASPGALFEAALARAAAHPCPRDHAALHWAAVNDEAIALCTGQQQLARAWAVFVAANDHEALCRFSGATIRLILDDPFAWRDMPQGGEIIRVAMAVEAANPRLGEELAGLGKAMLDLEREADA
ncbi:hypothetical protein SAMN05444002_0080 [Vannielia litorea]|uniref:Uncharacterized protein n=2 Tax=Vannielia litorea TaxID=1217970 RepID=A0A1N6DWC8_9RHOB|nr:hypothetical protein SAMN05444002_0080 [Vannielia litorea]